MRRIFTISGPPESFKKWLKINEVKINDMISDERYSGDNIWSFFRDNKSEYDDLKRILIKDQGFICCYCGQRIRDDSHTSIEHLQPKSKYKNSALDFDNLLASCKGSSGFKVHVVQEGESLEDIARMYGVDVDYLEDVYVNVDEERLFRKRYDLENLSAGDRIVIIPKLNKKEQHCDIRKANNEINIHPLQDDCFEKFSYSYIDGKVEITDVNASTVNTLGLNANRFINQLRKKKLEETSLLKEQLINDFGDSPGDFKKNREKLIDNLNNLAHSDNKFEPFVFVMIWSLIY